MKFIGFNFNKISAEKLSSNFENLKVNTNINISKINELKSDLLKSKEEMLNIEFLYTINYSKVAKIEFLGNVMVSEKPKITKEILKKWEKKEVPENFQLSLFNFILRKSNVKALQLEDEINIPLHISLPVLKKQESK